MQDKDGSVRGSSIDFLQCWHPALGELKFAPATNDAHPLTCWSAFGLLLQHSQPIRERRHAVPAQFHIVVQAAADDVEMRVIQSGDDAAAIEIDEHGIRPALITLRVVHADDAAIFHGETGGFGMTRIECSDFSVVKNQVGRRFRVHEILSLVGDWGCSQPRSSRVTTGITTQDSRATTQALKTALRRANGHSRITGPMVKVKIMASGKTPMNVAMAIFQRGGGLCGERNHASSPCKGRAVHESV